MRANGTRIAAVTVLMLIGLASTAGSAAAQTGGCRLSASLSGPPRQILLCPDGVSIEAESTADVQVTDPTGAGTPTAARVNSGAVLVDVPITHAGGFQILTPRALAAVRGTQWAVDASESKTEVFVLRGSVEVTRTNSHDSVVLEVGQGVEVGMEPGPLTATYWSDAQKSALLSRFGR